MEMSCYVINNLGWGYAACLANCTAVRLYVVARLSCCKVYNRHDLGHRMLVVEMVMLTGSWIMWASFECVGYSTQLVGSGNLRVGVVYSPKTTMSRKPVFGLTLLRLAVALRESLVLPVVSRLSTMGGMLIACRSFELMATSFERLLVALSPLD